MSDVNTGLQSFVRNWFLLRVDSFKMVQPKTETSKTVHLEVWECLKRPYAIGIELDHSSQVNFWIEKRFDPKLGRPSITQTEKKWTGTSWIGGNERGANSNLKGYNKLKGRNLIRFEVFNEVDARVLLEALN